MTPAEKLEREEETIIRDLELLLDEGKVDMVRRICQRIWLQLPRVIVEEEE